MNTTITKLFLILGVLGAILGLIFSFLPISNLAIFPATIGLILGLLGYSITKKKNGKLTFSKIVIILSLIAILISAGKQLFTENTVAEDTESIQRDVQSEEDAIEDLEDLDELEDLE